MAKTYLARCYEEGIGVEKNLTRAAEIYHEQANIGNLMDKKASAYYGMCLIHGHGVKQNTKLGLKIV